MFWPAVTSSVAACPVPTARRLMVIGAASAMSRASCWSSSVIWPSSSVMRRASDHRAALAACSGSRSRRRSGRKRSHSRARARLVLRAVSCRRRSPWRGDDQAAERVQRSRALLDGAVARDPQLADRLDDPAGVLSHHGPVGGQHMAGGQFGVDRVALAARRRVCGCGWLTSSTCRPSARR